ncbi:MAG: nucleotide-binding protein [Candidatus Bathyarchaeota archaeon]|nr:nucleotide-binding protein [Candidatus Bathyarchaeota archaeon]
MFVVHGMGEEIKSEVVQTLHKLELEPIVLSEQPNIQQTLIEKSADYANISFAVVILTPDELAYSKEQTADQARTQPNQNTVFLLGYLIGRLGPENVVVVYPKTKDFQIPDMYDGVLWVEHKTGWYFELIKQLQACNYDVDANNLGWI